MAGEPGDRRALVPSVLGLAVAGAAGKEGGLGEATAAGVGEDGEATGTSGELAALRERASVAWTRSAIGGEEDGGVYVEALVGDGARNN